MNLDESPLFKIQKLTFLAEKLIDRELSREFDVSFSQFRVMHVIARHPGISQKEVALIQEMTQAAVSRHVDALERLRYIMLAISERNRKEHELRLTREGERRFEAAAGFVENRTGELLGDLAERDTTELEDAIDHLLAVVRKHYGNR
jgi:DNA-binding MarR family transcriptional regulator